MMLVAAGAAVFLLISLFVPGLFARWWVTLPLAGIALAAAWMYLGSGDNRGPLPPRQFFRIICSVVVGLLIINYIHLSHNWQSIQSYFSEQQDTARALFQNIKALQNP